MNLLPFFNMKAGRKRIHNCEKAKTKCQYPIIHKNKHTRWPALLGFIMQEEKSCQLFLKQNKTCYNIANDFLLDYLKTRLIAELHEQACAPRKFKPLSENANFRKVKRRTMFFFHFCVKNAWHIISPRVRPGKTMSAVVNL